MPLPDWPEQANPELIRVQRQAVTQYDTIESLVSFILSEKRDLEIASLNEAARLVAANSRIRTLEGQSERSIFLARHHEGVAAAARRDAEAAQKACSEAHKVGTDAQKENADAQKANVEARRERDEAVVSRIQAESDLKAEKAGHEATRARLVASEKTLRELQLMYRHLRADMEHYVREKHRKRRGGVGSNESDEGMEVYGKKGTDGEDQESEDIEYDSDDNGEIVISDDGEYMNSTFYGQHY